MLVRSKTERPYQIYCVDNFLTDEEICEKCNYKDASKIKKGKKLGDVVFNGDLVRFNYEIINTFDFSYIKSGLDAKSKKYVDTIYSVYDKNLTPINVVTIGG